MRSKRRRLLACAGGAILTLAPQWLAAAESRRVAIIAVGSLDRQPLASLVEGLREFGHVDGRTITLDPPSGDGKYARLLELATQAVARKADVLVAYGTSATEAARAATRTLPIVMVAGGDPVERGYTRSLARPDGNITGLTTAGQVLSAKRIELLKELLPGMRRLAVLLNPESAGQAVSLKLASASAARVGIKLEVVEIRNERDLDAAASALARLRPDALLPLAGTMFVEIGPAIVRLAAASRLPAVYSHADFVRAGGLMSYSPDPSGQLKRAAFFVDRLLKGTKVSDLPIEQPTIYELAVNLRTARGLGITVPKSILIRAGHVIE